MCLWLLLSKNVFLGDHWRLSWRRSLGLKAVAEIVWARAACQAWLGTLGMRCVSGLSGFDVHKSPRGALAELQSLCQWFWWGGFLLRTPGSADSLMSRAHCKWLIRNSSLIGRQEWFSFLPTREGRHGGIEYFSQCCTVGKRWRARIWTQPTYQVMSSAGLWCVLKSEAIHEVVQGSNWRPYSCVAHHWTASWHHPSACMQICWATLCQLPVAPNQ